MQTLVEIGPSYASQGQHRRKDATEQMEHLTLARTFSSMLPMRSVGRSNFDKGLQIKNKKKWLKKRHIITRTAILYDEINSGQIMKENTKQQHVEKSPHEGKATE